MADLNASESGSNGDDLAIGIIGGIGPAATVKFMSRVLALTPARFESDHVRMLVDCNPKLPDMNAAALGNSRDAVRRLQESGRWLADAGADVLVVICNAAHCFEKELRQALDVPLLSMIDASCDSAAVLNDSGRGIGVLATDGCVRADIYGRALRMRSLDEITLSGPDMRVFLQGLRMIKSDEGSKDAIRQLDYCAARLVDAGASSIIVACTEAAIALNDCQPRVPYIDPVEELARVTVATAKQVSLDHHLQRDASES